MANTDDKRVEDGAEDKAPCAAENEMPNEDAPEAAAQDQGAADDPVSELTAQVDELKDQLLRALAETENLRRRSQREREDAVRYATAPFAKDMIEVADNLSRALEAVPPDAVEADEHLKTLMTGVRMTEKALQSVFEKHHIRRIDPMGQRMDPHAHEALFEVPDPSQPAGTVVQVIRSGYRLHDRLLRAAQVGVAKGGPTGGGPTGGGPVVGANGEGTQPGSRVDTSA
jgi:molecular chaperone GrpE